MSFRSREALDIVDAVLQLPREQWNAYLDQCRLDAPLRQYVESLLRAHDTAGQFLAGPAVGPYAEHFSGTGIPAWVPQQLGPYRLVGLIAEGGMGAVYRAVRADNEYEKQVAVKIIKQGADTTSALARFRAERQILANLEHPNIARLLDGGATTDGLPYFVMELVEGDPIDRYCSRCKLSTEDRLRLFQTVCSAIAYAHRKNIIHRDLKPANILVTADGMPKLLDFGIAKILDPAFPRPLQPTLTLLRMLTPEYASPEQVRGAAITAASDVYSLGTILYLLLTDQLPFDFKSAGLHEISRIICETQPIKPSAVITQTAERQRGAIRDAATDKLRRRLSGDLDTIVLKALRKEPHRRYASAEDLSDDIGRHLKGLPVRARKDTITYRASRFVKRNSVAVTMALLLLILLGAALGWLAHTSGIRQQVAVRSILVSDLENHTGEEIFDGALKRAIVVKLEESPYLTVVSDDRVQQSLRFMGKPSDAQVTSALGREICERQNTEVLLTSSITRLGNQYLIGLKAEECRSGRDLANEQIQTGRREAVLSAVAASVARLRRKLGESLSSVEKYNVPIEDATTSSLEALRALTLGDAERAKGSDAAAVPFYLRALDLDPNFAMAYATLAATYANIGEHELSSRYSQRAFELRDRVSERERLYISAHYFGDTGRLREEVEQYELWKQAFPQDWIPHNNLCSIYGSLGWFDKALPDCQNALRLEPNDPLPYTSLTGVYLGLNRFEDAKATAEKQVARGLGDVLAHGTLYMLASTKNDIIGMNANAAWGGSESDLQIYLLSLRAESSAQGGRLQEATELWNHSVALARHYGFTQVAAQTIASEAQWLCDLGMDREARQLAERALAIDRASSVEATAASTLATCGSVVRARGLADHLAKISASDTLIKSVLLPLIRSRIALRSGKPKAALAALDVAVPYDFAPSLPSTPYAALYVRGQAYLAVHDEQRAKTVLNKIVNHNGVDPLSPYHALVWVGLARAASSTGARAEALHFYEKFLSAWKDADADIPILSSVRREFKSLSLTGHGSLSKRQKSLVARRH